jgi:hypothetical protein
MLKPTFEVEVADPDTLRPESVVVPNPVEETERNDVFVLPVAFVEEDIENSVDRELPYGLSIENWASGVLVPKPSDPVDVKRPHSVRPAAEPFVKNARSAAGVVDDTLVKIDAIRAVEVADVVAVTQPASEHNRVSLNKRPVPMPAAAVVDEKCVSDRTSLIAPTFESKESADTAVEDAVIPLPEVVVAPLTYVNRAPPKPDRPCCTFKAPQILEFPARIPFRAVRRPVSMTPLSSC